MRKTILTILLFFPLVIIAQTSFTGIVKNKKTNEVLPFATIITDIGLGEICDVEGKFSVNSKKTISQLTVSYVGYKTRKIRVSPTTTYLTILLEPSTESLNEVVVVAKENPALQIIRNAIKSKSKNDIEKALNSFSYTAYNKLLVTANPDSINGKVDSIFVLKNDKRVFKKVDSTNYEFKKQLDKQHLYITEKVSEYAFRRGKNKKETILASRMAGFTNPIYEVLALNIENFTFYDEVYTLLGSNYVNPLAKNALKKYSYQILDTIVTNNHMSFMIYYKPKEKGDAVGLEGLLYINSKSYALQKGIAELKGIVSVKAEQLFQYNPQHAIWFPKETQISIRKGKSKENVKLFGGMVNFSDGTQKNDSIIHTKKRDPSDVSYLISKSENFDVKINEPVRLVNSASIIEIDDDAGTKDEQFWNRYRTDSITLRGRTTYQKLDSIVAEEKIEKKLNSGRKLIKGYFPSKYFDIDLSQLINFNSYEGFRLGIGGITNSVFSKIIRFDGYTAYGFRDTEFKWHLGASIRLNRNNNTWFGVGLTDDLQEAAKIDFLFDDTSFSLINPRNLNIGQFYGYQVYDINLSHDIVPNLESKLKLSQGSYDTKFNYQFVSPSRNIINYQLSIISLGLKWTPFSKYMNSPIGKLSIKKSFPKVTAQINKSFMNVFMGDFNFTQFNLKFEHTIKTLKNSSTAFLLQGGFVKGEAPLSHLYNATPNYALKNPWIKRINFSGTNAFETMTFNEFISDRYIMLQGRHNFKRFKLGSRFKPTLSLISRFAIGSIDNPSYHVGVDFKKMNKGYLESGFVVNHLFRGFGIGTFYRYGAYSNPKFSDNLAVKLTYVLSLGI